VDFDLNTTSLHGSSTTVVFGSRLKSKERERKKVHQLACHAAVFNLPVLHPDSSRLTTTFLFF
jgi:hypothetical protein